MARKHEEEEHENHERWLVSYADFITLLFAFFVVMYSISSINEGKYRVLSEALTEAFRPIQLSSRSPSAIEGQASASAVHAFKPAADPEAEARRLKAKLRTHELAEDLKKVLDPLVKGGQVNVSEGANGVSIEINSNVLFRPGEAQLGREASLLLRTIAEVVAGGEFPIQIEGHTDNTPIANAMFPSNWELSAVRASSVVRLFSSAGVGAKRLSAAGYGDQRPVADNQTLEGQQRNRRVAILLETMRTDQPADGTPARPRSTRVKNAEGALGTPEKMRLVPAEGSVPDTEAEE